MNPMPRLLVRFAPRLGLLLLLAAALGGFIFLFELFTSLKPSGSSDLLEQNPSLPDTVQLRTGVDFMTTLLSITCMVLAVGSFLLVRRRLAGRFQHRFLPDVIAAVPAAGLSALGVYFAAAGMMGRNLPMVQNTNSHHEVNTAGVDPLGLALLAACLASIAAVGIVRPRGLPAAVAGWLLASLLFGMLQSSAIHGLNLFAHPSTLEAESEYVETMATLLPQEGPGGEVSMAGLLQPDPGLWSDTDAAMAPGPEVHHLENGGTLAESGAQLVWEGDITADQASKPESIAVFAVEGAVDTRYLRSEVGDTYRDGGWAWLETPGVTYEAGAPVRQLVEQRGSEFGNSGLLSWTRVEPANGSRPQQITLHPIAPASTLPSLASPVSLNLETVGTDGEFNPFAATFTAAAKPEQFSWTSQVPEFSEEQLAVAVPSSETAYQELPADLPPKVRELALRITNGHDGAYRQAKAIEDYLQDEYTYSFAALGDETASAPADPVESFLFETRKGTAGQFSSAFVLLARSAGIPARVVSGWAIAPVGVRQTVTSDLAHQWAEVAFEDLGWVTFDPAKGRGPTARASKQVLWLAELGRLAKSLHESAEPETRLEATEELLRFADRSPLPGELVVEPLSVALGSDPSAEVRAASAEALGELGDLSALRPLGEAVAEDEDSAVRIAAAEALAKLGYQDGILPLIEALDDVEDEVREAGEEALTDLRADVSQLETGGMMVSTQAGPLGMVAGTSSEQAEEPSHNPVFQVEGAANLGYLRTRVGDTYRDGSWSQTTPWEVRYEAGASVPALVGRELPGWYSEGGQQPSLQQESALLGRPAVTPSGAFVENAVRVTPAPGAEALPTGVLPVSRYTTAFRSDGYYRVFSGTWREDEATAEHGWTAEIPVFSSRQLQNAKASTDPVFVQLPDTVTSRVRELAQEITAGRDSPYSRAKAIEKYLRNSYTYAFSEPGDPPLPAGQDPVDWFLFDARKGTCGQFSSAFVVLARAVGVPSRVVSGWVVSPTNELQTIYTDQAHQWAEVALTDVGWVTFEPTASSGDPAGAPDRTPGFEEPVAVEDQLDLPQELEEGLEDVAVEDPELAEAVTEGLGELPDESAETLAELVEEASGGGALTVGTLAEALEKMGATATGLEEGGSFVNWGGTNSYSGGTTTEQARDNPSTPVFQVTGAGRTKYLRTTTGDVYVEGSWKALDPVELEYDSGSPLQDLVAGTSRNWSQGTIGGARPAASGTLAWPKPGVGNLEGVDSITVSAHSLAGNLPPGELPVSLALNHISVDGFFRPFGATFHGESSLEEYSWDAEVFRFSENQLASAALADDPIFSQLPPGLPPRIRELALEITRGHNGPYRKARAIESYLRSEYAYAFADADTPHRPEGQDPVDWFLFDQREGTCGQFSSAFVVLARSVGIPARVVSGWAIKQGPETQTVYSKQAHQWAEVPFQEMGWITFEPTASGGAPTRAELGPGGASGGSGPGEGEGGDGGSSGASGGAGGSGGNARSGGDSQSGEEEGRTDTGSEPAVPEESQPLPPPRETVTEITHWPERTRLGVPFSISGTVNTTSGVPVDGMAVELFINTEKENGGILLGSGATRQGRFVLSVDLPPRFLTGNYQLIAHAIANPNFAESWSDPAIGVYSGTEMQFRGPSELSITEKAQFRGGLSRETGGVVAGQTVEVRVDDEPQDPVMTDGQGEFAFEVAFQEPGDHTITVELVESNFLLGNLAHLGVLVTMPSRLDLETPVGVRAGDEVLFSGKLSDHDGEPLQGMTVTLTLDGLPPRSAVTGPGGEFEVQQLVEEPGVYGFEAAFAGDGLVEPSSRRSSLQATEPVYLEVTGDRLVRAGTLYRLEGTLTARDGQPLPSMPLIIDVPGMEAVKAATDGEGGFSWETVFEDAAEATVSVAFAGTGELEPYRALWPVTVGAPEIVVESPEPVARGDTLSVRGIVVMADRFVPNVEVTVNDEFTVPTNAAGAFVLRYPVSADAELGPFDLNLTSRELETGTTAAATVMSTTRMIVVPLEKVKLGSELPMELQLLDDQGLGIVGAVVTYEPDTSVTTGPGGIASWVINTPDREGLTVLPMTFRFDGDDSNLPVTHLLALPVAPASYYWILWAALPLAAIASGGGAYFAGRRGLGLDVLSRLPFVGRDRGRESAPEGLTLAAVADPNEKREAVRLELTFPIRGTVEDMVWRVGETVRLDGVLSGESGPRLAGARVEIQWGAGGQVQRLTTDGDGRFTATWDGEERGSYEVTVLFPGDREHAPAMAFGGIYLRGPVPTHLVLSLTRPAEDLPDIWGIGEHVQAEAVLTDESGLPVPAKPLVVRVDGLGQPVHLSTDDRGSIRTAWAAGQLGAFTANAEFAGDGDYLPSSAGADFQVVVFREDVVSRYNAFIEWIRQRVASISDRETPREVEAKIIRQGVQVDQRSLEEVISRFEEADYSTHEIDRARFEAMFRACRELMTEPAMEQEATGEEDTQGEETMEDGNGRKPKADES